MSRRSTDYPGKPCVLWKPQERRVTIGVKMRDKESIALQCADYVILNLIARPYTYAGNSDSADGSTSILTFFTFQSPVNHTEWSWS